MTDSPDPAELARIERTLLTLPRRTRDIFLAHRLDGLSYERIASRTGLSVGEVERHIAKAMLAIGRPVAGSEREG